LGCALSIEKYDDIKLDLKVIGSEDLNWLNRVRDRDHWRLVVNKATNFWRQRISGDFVTGRMAVGLLHGLTTGKGSYCKGTTFVRCFLCNAEPYGGHAVRVLWYAGSLRQEVFATSSVQSLGAFAELRTTTVSFVLSVFPSAWNITAPAGRIFIKFGI
jgi:hypothetical protein